MRGARASASVLFTLLLAGTWLIFPSSPVPRLFRGEVTDGKLPLAGAQIHFQALPQPSTTTDRTGRFTLPHVEGDACRITAWKQGYTIGAVSPSQGPLSLTLRALPANDNEDYAWVDPLPDARHPNNCGNCHGEIVRQWSGSGHARAARNRHLLNLYEGTDAQGHPSESWNLLAEHPLGAGVCATCHAPTFSDPTLRYDLRQVAGVARQGVHCDYCHKIVDAPTDKLGMRFGRDGLALLRPADRQQLFFGPLDDAYREGEAFGYEPLYKESRICASCHEGVVFGVHVYGTYSEWLASPARRQGQQCQNCHMSPTGALTNLAPGKGGIDRDPRTLASHDFPGGQEEMLRSCLAVTVKLAAQADGLCVHAEVLAAKVGHRVPTGFIDRNLLLVVEALDRESKPTRLLEGPKLPATAGRGFAGLPGTLYAKQLKSLDGQHAVPFWLAHDEPEDTRLSPGRPDRQQFRFSSETEMVRVRLLYRRFWQEVAQRKGWQDNEIVVVDRTVSRTRP